MSAASPVPKAAGWDAALYLKFANERTQPALDLIGRIGLADPMRVIDLGCGPGNSTAMLHRRWPEAQITGLDNSAEMIAAAHAAYPDQDWLLGDAATWTAQPLFDLVFSNAALQWLPEHAKLFEHLMAQVAPAGALAVQLPAHYASPLHQVLLEVASDPAWSRRMHGPSTALTSESAAFYYDLLSPLSTRLELWETEYYHVLDDAAAILNWIRGNGLRPFLSVLTPEEQARFEALVLEGYTKAYPAQKGGKIPFPFRRTFMVAYKGAAE